MCCFLILRHIGDAALYLYVEWARTVYVCILLVCALSSENGNFNFLIVRKYINRSFDEKQEIAKRGKCYEKPC